MSQSLTHAQVYSQINNGDLMFVSNFNHISARIIQFVTRSSYSHVGILFWIVTPYGNKRLMVAEAQGGTPLRVQDFDFYCRRPLHIVAAPKDFITYENVALTGIGQIKYGYLDALYTGVRDFFFNYLNIKLPQKDFHGEICSEYVARVLQMPSTDLSPQDLFNELKATVKFSVDG
jgi:hypothetical protein